MKNIRIRGLLPEDIHKIGALIGTRDEIDRAGCEKRVELLKWLAFSNPYANGEPTYFVAEDGERIVAHLGRMPTKFLINGKIESGYFVHDLYVDPEHRKQGKGLFLTMALYKATEANSASFCCLVWTSDLNLQMQRVRGYHEMCADRYVKLLNPCGKLEEKLGQNSLAKAASLIFRGLGAVVDSILFLLVRSRVNISRIHRFDSRFDAMNQRAGIQKLGIMPLKTSEYLNWKFTQRPFSRTVVFAAEKNNEILGYIVLDIQNEGRYQTGAIVDIMVDPDDRTTVYSLVIAAIKHFRREKVHYIRCCLSNKKLGRIFKRFFFFNTFFYKEPVMLANLEKFSKKNSLTNINHWHLTYAASDEGMLTG